MMKKHYSNKSQTGMTLIELMVVVVILIILMTVALPAYQDSMMKSRRADGRAGITNIVLAQEKLRGNCVFYAQAIAGADACGGTAATTTVAGGANSQDGFYALSIRAASASGNSFIVEADPQGAQADDTDCDPIVYTVNAANPDGLRTPADCWR
jgi:type IV pilus assembly protein PilE